MPVSPDGPRSPHPSTEAGVANLVRLLQLTPSSASDETDRTVSGAPGSAGSAFAGAPSEDTGVDATFGGHLLGQATAAALATVDADRPIHSLHGYFIRAGRNHQPFRYDVERVRDGRSFSTRHVHATQDPGKPLFQLIASFAVPEDGPNHEPLSPPQACRTDTPDDLPTYRSVLSSLDKAPFPEAWINRDDGIDIRPTRAAWHPDGLGPGGSVCQWIRAAGPLPNDPGLHAAALAYQSDESLADALFAPFDVDWGQPGTMLVSLDHSLWFHRTPDLNEWLYVEQRPAVVHGGRGVAHATMWNQAGALVASASQEALIRLA